jgi:molybdate transport system substrate-binding protein
VAAGVILLVWGSTPAAAQGLLVGAAVSLREPITEIAERFETSDDASVDLSFGASSVLAIQIRAGAPIDVLISADEEIVERLETEGLANPGGRAVAAYNRLVVMTRRDGDLTVERAEDLLRPEVQRIAVPEYAVPIGRYARDWLSRRDLLTRLEDRIVPTEHARATLAAVDFGHADVAIVYATDARVARSARVAFEVAPAEQPRIAYAAAVVASSRHPEAAARFLRFLISQDARDLLRAAGFGVPAASVARPGAAPR